MRRDATIRLPSLRSAKSTLYSLKVRIAHSSDEPVGVARTIEKPMCIVGRSTNADVVLEDPTVSFFHLEMQGTDRGIHIRDCGSTNGVFFGSAQMARGWVQDGAVLRVGNTQITVYKHEPLKLNLSPETVFGSLRGSSPCMRRCFEELKRAAATSITLLITGESGTGKEMAARAIHEHSNRARGPFVTLDCGALPPSLIESQLFGHEAGSFTGAAKERRGAFRAAHRGTLFLDEIGELPLDLQAKLLGAIERREVVPVGSDIPVPVDVRIICATLRDLQAMVNNGTFRLDLYQRITPPVLRLPPLREHPEDIPDLVAHFAGTLAQREPSASHIKLTNEALDALVRRDYPGNVRELAKLIEYVAAFADSPMISLDDLVRLRALANANSKLAASSLTLRNSLVSWKQAKGDCEKEYLTNLVRETKNITQASELSGIPISRLNEKLDFYSIKKKSQPFITIASESID